MRLIVTRLAQAVVAVGTPPLGGAVSRFTAEKAREIP
jgi:hypothetical protein